MLPHDLPLGDHPMIIQLANHLIRMESSQRLQNCKFTGAPLIKPTADDDPQPNPSDAPEKIFLFAKQLTPEREEDMIVQSVVRWLEENPEQTVAILVTRNEKGANLVQKLKDRHIRTVELLQTSFATRKTAKKLANLLAFFADPLSSKKLSMAFEALYEDQFEEPELKPLCMCLRRGFEETKQMEDIPTLDRR